MIKNSVITLWKMHRLDAPIQPITLYTYFSPRFPQFPKRPLDNIPIRSVLLSESPPIQIHRKNNVDLSHPQKPPPAPLIPQPNRARLFLSSLLPRLAAARLALYVPRAAPRSGGVRDSRGARDLSRAVRSCIGPVHYVWARGRMCIEGLRAPRCVLLLFAGREEGKWATPFLIYSSGCCARGARY